MRKTDANKSLPLGKQEDLTNILSDDAEDEGFVVVDIPEEKKKALEKYAKLLSDYIQSDEYYQHMKDRGYSDEEIIRRRKEAIGGLRDVLNANDSLRSFATVFASAPPEELRQMQLSREDLAMASKWYAHYSSLLEATTLYEAVKLRRLDAQSDLVDKLLTGTVYAFGHTSRRTGVMPNYFATRSILTGTLSALENLVHERVKQGMVPDVKDALNDLSKNGGLQKRLIEHVLVETGVADWADEQKSRLRTETRTVTSSTKKGSLLTRIVVAVAPSQKSSRLTEPTANPAVDDLFMRLRGNIIGGVWSMVNAIRSKDAPEAVRNGAVPFSDIAKKTLNYSYQLLSSQRLGGVEGRQFLPHDPLTVRDVWETAGTLGQLRVITDTVSEGNTLIHTGMNTEHLNNIFVPFGFRIGYDHANDVYTVTPIEEVWEYIKRNPKELTLYHDLAKNVVPSQTLQEIPLFDVLPPDIQSEVETLKKQAKGEVKVSTAHKKGIPIFRSQQEDASSFLITKKRSSISDADKLKTSIANAISKHINSLYSLTKTFRIGTDFTETGKRYWIGFDRNNMDYIQKTFGNTFDPLSMTAFENNGATVIRDENGNIREIRFYEDEAGKLFTAEEMERNAKPQKPILKDTLNRFSAFVNKAITSKSDLFAGFAPSIVETYTTADETYRQNIQALRQRMEQELTTATPAGAETTTLKRRLKTIIPTRENIPMTQETQAQCWLAYRNATLKMGAFKKL